MNAQRTLRRTVSCTGIGLHSGNKVTLSLKPAPADYGIRFQRSDLGGLEIPATVTHLGGIQYQTGLTREAVSVETVEHLLAALTALGIDNAIVELNHPEVPIMDGSAAPFVYLILNEAGVKKLSAAAPVPEGDAADLADPRRQAHRAVSLGSLQGHLQHQLRPPAAPPPVADDEDHRGQLRRRDCSGPDLRLPEGSRDAPAARPGPWRLARQRHRPRGNRCSQQRASVRGRVRPPQDPGRDWRPVAGRSSGDRSPGGAPRRARPAHGVRCADSRGTGCVAAGGGAGGCRAGDAHAHYGSGFSHGSRIRDPSARR